MTKNKCSKILVGLQKHKTKHNILRARKIIGIIIIILLQYYIIHDTKVEWICSDFF